VATYTVTFQDWDGSAIDTQQVEHGGSASAPADPEREGYTFNGWDKEFTNITSDLTVTATYTSSSVGELNDLILAATARTRPDYTTSIEEWNTYWVGFETALSEAEQVYENLIGKGTLSDAGKAQLDNAKKSLQRAVEILDGIEDFDDSFGDRANPKGLVETVYERSLVSGGFQPHRLRCYYEKEKSDFYWLLSGYQQGQGFYAGTTGTGMNDGLQNVMSSAAVRKLKSGEHTVEIYHPDGTKKTKEELQNEGINLAMHWVFSGIYDTGNYVDLVGFSEVCQLIGETSDGTEFERTYTFHFVDASVHLFDPNFRYCVVDGVVQRKVEGFKIFNETQNIKYTEGTIQDAVDNANVGDKLYVAPGTYYESVTINKSITLLGDFGNENVTGTGPVAPILDGTNLSGVPGIQIVAGISDVTIKGFAIKNYDSGGIVSQGDGIKNITIENNYIHDVGNDGVLGGTSGAQTLSGWSVSKNIIDDFAGTGICLENVSNLEINKNKISNYAFGSSIAIELTSRADTNSVTMSGVTVSNNEISGFPDGAVNITSRAKGALSATAENVTISNNTFSGGAVNIVAQAEDASSSATMENVSINGNEITGNFRGVDVQKQGSGTTKLQSFTITGNSLTMNNPKEAGCAVHLANVGGASSFSDNTITITGTIGNAGNAFDGVVITGGATGSWTITGNELDGNNVGTASSGFRLRSSLPATATLTLTGNSVTKWAQGILSDALTVGTKVEVRCNWIFDNSGYGISNASSGATIDAILNYWGHVTGPHHAELNKNGEGNAVGDNVNFVPWHQDADFISLSDGTVVNTDQGKYYHSIQVAVNEADPGDTIRVWAGTYNEHLIIEKSITLIGDPGEEGVPGPGPNAPVLDGIGIEEFWSAFQIRGASNVVIEGFEIKNFGRHGIEPYDGNENYVTFRHNYIHDIGQNGVYIFNHTVHTPVLYDWVVTHNVIERFATGQFGLAGIEIMDCVCNVEINNNTITGDARAIFLRTAKDGCKQENISITDNNLASTRCVIEVDSEVQNLSITGNNITVKDPTDFTSAVAGLGHVSGTGSFSGNTIEVVGDGSQTVYGAWISGTGTADWIIEDNVFDGKSVGNIGILCWNVSASTTLDMNRNTVTGWVSGIIMDSAGTKATLCSNLIFNNLSWGVCSYNTTTDAAYNYWGHESGPSHATNPDGQGNPVTDNVLFCPWYTDEECTTTSDGSDPLAMGLMQAMLETVTVTFNGNGGTPATTEVEVEGEATLETLPTITRDGYTFAGWNTLQDGTGEVFTIETVVTADMTVYAIWEEAVVGMPTIVS
ncbi:MAG: InlB B-repeat-containing protein, partial [Christensenellales bacterium]